MPESQRTIAEMVADFPWSARMLERGEPLEWLWVYDLAATPEELWRHLIDTSRFNRALGLSRMEFEERDGVLHGWGKNGGFRQEWVEHPWDWVAGRWLISVREYSKGFAHFVRVIYRLEERDDGARLYVYMGWIPRGLFGKLALKYGVPSMEADYGRVLEDIVASLDQAPPPLPYRGTAGPLSSEATQRLGVLRDQLVEGGLRAEVVDRLVEHVRHADDMDVYRIQVRKLAHEWGIDSRELLRIALHATRLGMLEMTWDVICPHCRGVRTESNTLAGVPDRGACTVCAIDFATDSENALEITFHVHSSIREVPKLYFCSAEPSTKEHIKLQLAVAPGTTRMVTSALPTGRYRLRVKGVKQYQLVDVTDAEGEGVIHWSSRAVPGPRRRATPSCELALENDSDEPCTFVMEEVRWADVALRPAHLFNFQEFRDLFSREYLSTDVQLAVGEQTILFTDIVGSTAFYADQGDPTAFMEVLKHFVAIQEAVDRHEGAVVKTIGDAVMASFTSPVQALQASRQIHRILPPEMDVFPFRVRISLNTGPCIAVKLNANIDYFGSSVNVAAKLQAMACAGDIAMSKATHNAPGVVEYLESVGARVDHVTYQIAALGRDFEVFRWSTDPAVAPLAAVREAGE